MDSVPFVSIIIPTFNRADSLRMTVRSFLDQSYDPARFEILIVDNNSTDATPAAIANLKRQWSGVRTLSEPRKGAHFARNAGAREARGDILYFTDDDMLADVDLLRRIVEPFFEDPGVASVTGRVLPQWAVRPPEWIISHCRNELLSLVDLGASTFISDDDPGVFSCHQAVRREIFFRAGGFNPDTNAGTFVGDNETGLNIKIRKLGYRFAYAGRAVIRHVIPASRMSQAYLNSRFRDQGLCDSYTGFRRDLPSRAKLALAMLRSAMMIPRSGMVALIRLAAGNSVWRLNLARIFYYKSRILYDSRLLRSAKWRSFALRDDWVLDD